MISAPLNDVLWKAINGHGLSNVVVLTEAQAEALFGPVEDDAEVSFPSTSEVKK